MDHPGKIAARSSTTDARTCRSPDRRDWLRLACAQAFAAALPGCGAGGSTSDAAGQQPLAPDAAARPSDASAQPATPLQDTVDSTSAPTSVRAIEVATGLEHPWGLAFLPDGRMLVTERPGRMRLITASGNVSEPLAGVPAVFAQGQGGLLDVALDPGFATNRLLYVAYAEPAPGDASQAGTTVLRARLDERTLADAQVVFRQLPKVSGTQHFGCRLMFAPDGTLFITLGERNRRELAQDLSVHYGKILRLRSDGSVPGDNPFVTQPGARPEIWSTGHRNPQGAALHPTTGALWIADHGAQGGDEINVSQPGRNYGWPIVTYGIDYSGAAIGEGTTKPGIDPPLHVWDPSIAPSGMTFVQGERYRGWRGNLLVGALSAQCLVRLELDGTRIVREHRLLGQMGERIRDVRQGPDGFVYLLTDQPRGRLLRLDPV